jgi:hypothetical protein
MAKLAQEVAAGYHHFAIVQWVVVLNTFGVLTITWNVSSVQSALWRWIPDVHDSAVPFIVGAWLVAVSLIAVAGAVGTLHINWRERAEAEHLELLRRLGTPIRLCVGYLIAGCGFLLGMAWICSVYRPDVFVRSRNTSDPLALVVALISALALGRSVYLFHLHWREAIIYAQADQERGWKTTAMTVQTDLRSRRTVEA